MIRLEAGLIDLDLAAELGCGCGCHLLGEFVHIVEVKLGLFVDSWDARPVDANRKVDASTEIGRCWVDLVFVVQSDLLLVVLFVDDPVERDIAKNSRKGTSVGKVVEALPGIPVAVPRAVRRWCDINFAITATAFFMNVFAGSISLSLPASSSYNLPTFLR